MVGFKELITFLMETIAHNSIFELFVDKNWISMWIMYGKLLRTSILKHNFVKRYSQCFVVFLGEFNCLIRSVKTCVNGVRVIGQGSC